MYESFGGLKSMETHPRFKMSENADLEQSLNSLDLFRLSTWCTLSYAPDMSKAVTSGVYKGSGADAELSSGTGWVRRVRGTRSDRR